MRLRQEWSDLRLRATTFYQKIEPICVLILTALIAVVMPAARGSH